MPQRITEILHIRNIKIKIILICKPKKRYNFICNCHGSRELPEFSVVFLFLILVAKPSFLKILLPHNRLKNDFENPSKIL